MNYGPVIQETYCIRDLLDRLNIVARDQFIVGVEKFDAGLFEGSLSQQQAFNAGKTYLNVGTFPTI
jgi:hypothetical protein